MTEYKFNMDFKGKTLKFRKWKVKDKIKFFEGTKENDKNKIRDSLVYDCLENKNVVLNEVEYKYVLSYIRKTTIGDTIHYDLICDNCDNEHELDVNIDDVIIQQYDELKKVKTTNHIVHFDDIKNKDFYNNIIDKCKNSEEVKYMDMLLRISKIDSNDAFTFDELIEIFNEMDIDEAEEIINYYNENKFKLSLTKDIECPHCNNKTLYEFDFFPDFFPDSWFK